MSSTVSTPRKSNRDVVSISMSPEMVEEKLLVPAREDLCSGRGFSNPVDAEGAFATVEDCRDQENRSNQRSDEILLIQQAANFSASTQLSPAPSTSRSPPNAYQQRGRFVVWPVYLEDGATSCPPPLSRDD